MLLAPGRDYLLTARARVDDGDATLTVSSPDGSMTAWQLITDTTWQPVEIAFTTTDSWTGQGGRGKLEGRRQRPLRR